MPIRVVLIGDGWCPRLAGPFSLFNFADQPSIVMTAFLCDEKVSADYQEAVADLMGRALSPGESVELIKGIGWGK